jgi:poly(hydroxyalkanoate) depolymerase family esterase
MVSDHKIDKHRIFVTGLSAGGAMTSVMLASYPGIFAAGAIIAGLPYGVATNPTEAVNGMFQSPARPASELVAQHSDFDWLGQAVRLTPAEFWDQRGVQYCALSLATF